MDQINEAFQASIASSGKIPTQKYANTDLSETPKTIKYFEWLMYTSFVASAVIWIFQFVSTRFQIYMLTAMAIPIIAIVLKFFCVQKVVYYRAEWARIVLVVLLALNVFSIFGLFIYAFSNPIFLVTALPLVLEIAAIYFVFNTTSNAWLTTPTSPQENASYAIDNKKWTRVIPSINIRSTTVAACIFLIAFFSFGGPSIFEDSTMGFFAMIMLVVIVVLGSINYFESSLLAKKYSHSTSKLDTWFVTLTILRNIVFILNVIPFIQILGMISLVFGGIPYLITYYFMIRARNKSVIN
jgi:hypothetical protein